MNQNTHASMDSQVLKWAALALAAFVAGAFVTLAAPVHEPSAATTVGLHSKTG